MKKPSLFNTRGIPAARFTVLFFLFFFFPHSLFAQTPGTWHTPPDRWSEPRIFHTPFDKEFEKRIRISRVSMAEGKGEKVFSPNRAYWFSVKKPDFSKPDPWTTTLLIFNERDYLIRIQLIDHSSYEVKTRWVNEKLVVIEV